MKILITGANGQLGKSFQKIHQNYLKFEFIFLTKNDLDITNESLIDNKLNKIYPEVVINCAAYTNVDNAEKEPSQATKINTTSVEYLAKSCEKMGILFVHFSTDYVYHLNTKRPLKESDIPQPKGVYAITKFNGEKAIYQSDCKAIVIRTSWLYSEFNKNFFKTIINLANTKSSLSVVNDQIGSPTYATDLAITTLEIIQQYYLLPDHQILINFSNRGKISWYDFALRILSLKNISIPLYPISTKEYPTPALRPAWSVFDLTKINILFHLFPRSWDVALQDCIHLT